MSFALAGDFLGDKDMIKTTLNDFTIDPAKHVWVINGTIHIDSIFQKTFTGDLKLLLNCVEDNMTCEEEIDYTGAIRDYRFNRRQYKT